MRRVDVRDGIALHQRIAGFGSFSKVKQVNQDNIIHSITVGMGMSVSVDVTRLGRTGR